MAAGTSQGDLHKCQIVILTQCEAACFMLLHSVCHWMVKMGQLSPLDGEDGSAFSTGW